MWRFKHLAMGLLAGAALVAAGCGQDDSSNGGDPDVIEGDGDGLSDAGEDGSDGPDSGGESDSGGPDSGPTADECTRNADCGGGELCVEGVCRTACLSDADCPESLPVCDAAERLCVGCLQDDDCSEGEACVAGQCEAFCRSNRDCAGGQFCAEDGACVDIECTDDDDCDDGETCDLARFSCVQPECTRHADCAGGELCVDNRCESITGECEAGQSECTGDFGGRACDETGNWRDFVCDDALCVEGACVGSDPVCEPNARFCEGNTVQRCNAGGTVLTEVPCEDDEVCRGGFCVPDTGQNACGGEEALEGDPGAPCGECGTWRCDGAEAVECQDDGENACGGCGELEGEPGESCGSGAAWVCESGEAVACAPVGGTECTSDAQCQALAEDFDFPNPETAACDPTVGCYTVGRCGADDPFAAQCGAASECPANSWPGQPISCTGCDPMDASSCRAGEVCNSIFGLFTVCQRPDPRP